MKNRMKRKRREAETFRTFKTSEKRLIMKIDRRKEEKGEEVSEFLKYNFSTDGSRVWSF